MPTLRIDAEELTFALESHLDGVGHFLDLQTGLVMLVPDDPEACDIDEMVELAALVEQDPDRFHFIVPISSRQGFHMMEAFTATVDNPRAVEALQGALSRKHPFRGFKDALAHYPDLREEWYLFQRRWLLNMACDWLEQQEVDAELVLNDGHRELLGLAEEQATILPTDLRERLGMAPKTNEV